MLDADDVDDDYFTPVASTSLANIFSKGSKTEETKDNESLKYTPPKQQSVSQKSDDSKVTQCIFATALVGYEWVDNVYTCRGNLGFAILKIIKTGSHNIILYDSRKTSLSSSILTPTFEITINNNQSISYYDNHRKYWSLYVNEDGIKSIITLLKSFNVQIKHSSHTDNNPPEPNIELKKASTEEWLKPDVESDTDSTINRKTKMSILSRMANMGHSVLPINTNVIEKSSDSSDTTENITQSKASRHKPVKNVIKKLNTDKNSVICTPQKIYERGENQVALNTETLSDKPTLYTYVNGLLVPVTSTNLISNNMDRNINNMDLFVNEQRINNTEMRINVNRLNDKVDHILQKFHDLQKDVGEGSVNSLHTSVYQKLLMEYENKIKIYENIIKTKDVETDNTQEKIISGLEKMVQQLKLYTTELEQQNKEKTNEIARLNNALSLLQQEVTNYSTLNDNTDIINKIKDLENDLSKKEIQLKDITEKYDNVMQNKNESNIEDKIKSIMNSTYQTISSNFENNETYTGENIKKIIGVIIRNITLKSLNKQNSNESNS